METFAKLVMFFVFGGVVILLGSAAFGYACKSSSSVDVKEIASTPCSPVFPNGETNSHYYNMWYACRNSCQGKMANLDMKTCDCSCR